MPWLISSTIVEQLCLLRLFVVLSYILMYVSKAISHLVVLVNFPPSPQMATLRTGHVVLDLQLVV